MHRCLRHLSGISRPYVRPRTRDVVGLGLGVTVGAGVFMATGKAAEEAGPATGHGRDGLGAFRIIVQYLILI